MIPGFVISLITFPGVIFHEVAHAMFCRITRTEIYDICYFQFKNPVGYVVHAVPANIWKHLLIEAGPFILNTAIGFTLGCIIVLLGFDPKKVTLISGFSEWIAFSIIIRAFPSINDANNIWQALWNKSEPILARIIGMPLVAIIYIGAIGSGIGLDLFYGIIMVHTFPKMLYSYMIRMIL